MADSENSIHRIEGTGKGKTLILKFCTAHFTLLKLATRHSLLTLCGYSIR